MQVQAQAQAQVQAQAQAQVQASPWVGAPASSLPVLGQVPVQCQGMTRH